MAYAHNVKLDNWDPMTESYHDANINSYDNGPGVNLTPYARPPANAEYKLYVNQIPLELSETGIRQVFDSYGKTTSVMSPPGADWAFVTYNSFREAETAMRELNHKPPLNLGIAFAKKKETDSKKKNQLPHAIPNIEPVPPHTMPVLDNQRREYISLEQRPMHSRPPVRNLGRGRELAALARRVIAPPPGHMYNEYDDLLYPAIHDPNLYDPYEDAEPFSDTNNMWARGRLQISNDGSRFVSMGRGTTWYELPTPHPRVQQQIRAVYENREAGLYEYGENKVAPQIGKCQHCAQTATMRCQRCREFYCSRACQVNDWPRHRVECQTMPGLECGVDSASISISSGEETPLHVPAKRSIRKLRRPLQNAAPLAATNSTSTPVPATSPMPQTPAVVPEDIPNLNCKRNRTGEQKQVSEHIKGLNTGGGWKPMKNGSHIQPLRSCNSQSKEQIPNRGPNFSSERSPASMKQDYAVKQEPRKTSSQGSFDNKNNSNSRNAVGATQRVETQQQGAPKNSNFFRRKPGEPKIHSEINDQLKKMNIQDTGTGMLDHKTLLPDPDVRFHRASEMPETFSSAKTPPQVSFHTKNNDTVTQTSGNQFTPELVTNNINKQVPDQNVGETRVLNALAAPASPPKAQKKRKTIVELLDVNEEGCFEAHILLGSNKAAVTVCVLRFQEEYTKLLSELTPASEKLIAPLLSKPKVGEFLCGKRLDDWIRGTVTSLGPPIRLAAADEGRIEPVTDLKPVPEGFMNLPMLGAICELTQGDFKLERMAQYTFMVLNTDSQNIDKDGIEIVLFSADEKEGRGILKPWTPAPEQRGLPYATLKSGTEVCIASFRSHVLIFVRSLGIEEMENYNRITQDVAHWSTKASKLTDPPIVGEMVIAMYEEDKNFYRAIVRKINDSNITVSYVDYGNIETTTLDNIRSIPQKLKEYPSCAAKIVLQDVPKDVPMTKEVHEYLATLAGTEKPLMCSFEGCPATDGVVLRTANGASVNKKIVELLTPSWKKKEEDKTTVFMIGDLDVAELGAVGTTVNIITLFSYGPLVHAMAPQDMELIEHVTGVMAAQMEEYCKQKEENYIPRQSELCLAPYQGSWYRAVCLEANTTNTTATVNFIDFGNVEEIPHTDLRIITKDFMSAKTLASICQVVGLGPVDAKGELPPAVGARVSELITPNNVTLVKIVECTKPGEYTVELPEIKEILIKEGLLNL